MSDHNKTNKSLFLFNIHSFLKITQTSPLHKMKLKNAAL